jgi:hypothetical protein
LTTTAIYVNGQFAGEFNIWQGQPVTTSKNTYVPATTSWPWVVKNDGGPGGFRSECKFGRRAQTPMRRNPWSRSLFKRLGTGSSCSPHEKPTSSN